MLAWGLEESFEFAGVQDGLETGQRIAMGFGFFTHHCGADHHAQGIERDSGSVAVGVAH